ncbi:MAG TPA: hypothetical protein VFH80_16295 [Solirubrobacteraceae bacterium]|nr:hypothetical protein [Solirubrobacteraceae bacterium]
MGYKVLGFVVWQGAKLYLRRKAPDNGLKLAIAGAAGAVLIGGAAIALRRGGDGD